MALGPLTFLDLKKMEGTPGFDIVEENVLLIPELTIFPADVMAGNELRLTVRTDLPTVNFTRIGEGVDESKSGYITRLFECANMDALIKIPVNMLAGKPEALASRLMSNEQAGFVESGLRTISRQTWYGVGNDVKGFPGMIAQMLNDANHVIDAGGTTNNKTSIFFVSVGRGKQQYWFGNNKSLTFDDWYKATVPDSTPAAKLMEALCSWMHCTPGFQLENRNTVVRIKNVTAEAGHTATFDLLNQALRLMEDVLMIPPTHIFMTGRSLEQLRLSLKTDLLPNPTAPKDFEGIPIIRTAALSNAETI